MKIKVLVHIPPFETEVEIHDSSGMVCAPDHSSVREQYATNVALERFSDKLRSGESWFDSTDLVAKVEP